MLSLKRSLTHVALGLGLGAILISSGVGLVLATDGLTQTLSPGTRTSSVVSMVFVEMPYSPAVQNRAGVVTLAVDDSSGEGQGWNLLVQSSNFVYAGQNNGKDIPASNLAVVTANMPTATAGQPVDASAGPKAPASGSTGSLDTPRKTMQAQANAGMGAYTQKLDVSLTIPANSRVGSYTGTVTTTISAAP